MSENFTILSGEDKLFKEAKDHDNARNGMNHRARRNRTAASIKEYSIAVLNAFYDAYHDSYEMLEVGPDNYDGINCVLECPEDLFTVCTFGIGMQNEYECRLDYAFDDIEDIAESDVIRLTDDPKSSARLIHDTIEDYISEIESYMSEI